MREHVFVTHPRYLRNEARRLRAEDRLSLDEISRRLQLAKTTVWYWINDLPDEAIRAGDTPARQRSRLAAAAANRARATEKRDHAYRLGWSEFTSLDTEPGFRDFVCMYVGEGYKRSRNRVALGNSDPQVVRLADRWIRRFARNPVTYSLQYHANQDPEHLIAFWARFLGADPNAFFLQRKSNSGQLSGRKWRSEWGVLTVVANDTHLRARLQAWVDRVQDSWLDSIASGRSSAW